MLLLGIGLGAGGFFMICRLLDWLDTKRWPSCTDTVEENRYLKRRLTEEVTRNSYQGVFKGSKQPPNPPSSPKATSFIPEPPRRYTQEPPR